MAVKRQNKGTSPRVYIIVPVVFPCRSKSKTDLLAENKMIIASATIASNAS